MKIEVQRRYRASKYTIGTMSIDGVRFCDTLEPTDRDLNRDGDLDDPGEGKIMHETAIPYGTYAVSMYPSGKFKRELPLLHGVKHFEAILIHAGNTPADTSGCILVGENKIVGQLVNSRPYENAIREKVKQAIARGEKVLITIK